MKFTLEIDITATGTTFLVTGSSGGAELARGTSTEGAARALDLAIADLMREHETRDGLGRDRYKVMRMLEGFRGLLPAVGKDLAS